MSFGCVCDSSWAVGLGNGETQQSEWFGPDCSMSKHIMKNMFVNFFLNHINTFSIL